MDTQNDPCIPGVSCNDITKIGVATKFVDVILK